LREVYDDGTKWCVHVYELASSSIRRGRKGNVMVRVRTVLGDEIQPIGVQPHQLNIERVYPIFETFDPCDGVRRAICPRGRCTGLVNDEIWVSRRVSSCGESVL